jgi:erythritol transport system permease protein
MSVVARTLARRSRLANPLGRALLMLLRARAIVVLAALLITFSVLTPAFLTAANLSILSKHVAITGILAIGMTFVVLTGGIDLSVGSIAGLGGMVAGFVLAPALHVNSFSATSLAQAITATLLTALAVGILNGWLVARLAVAPFIATLGTLYMARGAALLISGGKTFPNLGGSSGANAFTALGQGQLLHIPNPVWTMAALFALAWFIASKTPLGRHIYAVGGNERAAMLAGIRVARVKLFTYVFSAISASLVGLIIASQLEAAHPATGTTFELNAIAAIVLGGISLSGGRGTVTGALIGAFVIGVLADGLVMLGVSEFWQMVIKGAVIVLAVSIDQLQTRVQARLLPMILRSNPEAGA